MSRSMFASSVVLVTQLAFVTVMAEKYHFQTCRLPVHDMFKNYYIMLNPYNKGDYACMRFSNATSLGKGVGSLLIAVKCVLSDGKTMVKLAPEGMDRCKRQVDALAPSRGGDKACRVREGLRLTGQNGLDGLSMDLDSQAGGFDKVYLTRGSFMCVERFGEEGQTAPDTEIKYCGSNDGNFQAPEHEMSSTVTHRCKNVYVNL